MAGLAGVVDVEQRAANVVVAELLEVASRERARVVEAVERLGPELGRHGVVRAELDPSPSIPVRSKRLELEFPGRGVTLVLGKLGGGADEQSNGKCRLRRT